MNCAMRLPRVFAGKRRGRAFTLAEVLAALAFLAIVIPVTVEGLRVATRAGRLGQARAAATRIADRVLNEWVVMKNQNAGLSRGTVEEGVEEYRWTLRSEPSVLSNMRLVTVEVTFTVQGEDYDVRLSSLSD